MSFWIVSWHWHVNKYSPCHPDRVQGSTMTTRITQHDRSVPQIPRRFNRSLSPLYLCSRVTLSWSVNQALSHSPDRSMECQTLTKMYSQTCLPSASNTWKTQWKSVIVMSGLLRDVESMSPLCMVQTPSGFDKLTHQAHPLSASNDHKTQWQPFMIASLLRCGMELTCEYVSVYVISTEMCRFEMWQTVGDRTHVHWRINHFLQLTVNFWLVIISVWIETNGINRENKMNLSMLNPFIQYANTLWDNRSCSFCIYWAQWWPIWHRAHTMDSMFYEYKLALLNTLAPDEIASFMPSDTFHLRDTKSRKCLQMGVHGIGYKMTLSIARVGRFSNCHTTCRQPNGDLQYQQVSTHIHSHKNYNTEYIYKEVCAHLFHMCAQVVEPQSCHWNLLTRTCTFQILQRKKLWWPAVSHLQYILYDKCSNCSAQRLMHCSAGYPIEMLPFDILGLVVPTCSRWPRDFSFVFVRCKLDVAMALSNHNVPFPCAFELVTRLLYNKHTVWETRRIILAADRCYCLHTKSTKVPDHNCRYLIDKYSDLDSATFEEFEHEARKHIYASSCESQPLHTSSPNACKLCLLWWPENHRHDLHPIFTNIGANILPYGIDENMLSHASVRSPELRQNIKDHINELQKIAIRSHWQTLTSHSDLHELIQHVFDQEITCEVIINPTFGAFCDWVCAVKWQGFDLKILAHTGWCNG